MIEFSSRIEIVAWVALALSVVSLVVNMLLILMIMSMRRDRDDG